jgi:Single-strand binding protein family
MAIHALISGVLWKTPEQRVSKTTGKSFTMATLRIKDGDEVQWVKLLVFGSDLQAEISRLGDGDALSVSGSLSAQIYQPSNREARVNLSMFVDAVLVLRQPPKPRKERAPDTQPASPPAAYDDDISF